jgi:hypothetical protein
MGDRRTRFLLEEWATGEHVSFYPAGGMGDRGIRFLLEEWATGEHVSFCPAGGMADRGTRFLLPGPRNGSARSLERKS